MRHLVTNIQMSLSHIFSVSLADGILEHDAHRAPLRCDLPVNHADSLVHKLFCTDPQNKSGRDVKP